MSRYNPKRDSKLYKQVIVAIPVHSEMAQFYQDEANMMHVGLPTLFYQLLEDRFLSLTGKGRNIWFSHSYQTPAPTEKETTKEQVANTDKGLATWGE